MKKYVDNFLQYRFLLSELVKKGIKLKYRRSYLGIVWSMLEPLLTMIVLTIVFGTLYGNTEDISGVYSDRTIVVQLLFTGNKGGIEIYQTEFGDDQESLCAEIFISLVQCAF